MADQADMTNDEPRALLDLCSPAPTQDVEPTEQIVPVAES